MPPSPTVPMTHSWGVLIDHSGWGLTKGKCAPTCLGTQDVTQLAVSVPALVVGGRTKEWRGEGQAAEKVGQPFMELPSYPSPYSVAGP